MTEQIYEARNRAFSLLEDKGLDSGAVSILLQEVTGKSHANLLADMREPLTTVQAEEFWRKMDILVTGTPIQYVVGTEVFYGRTFIVNESVLIPRPETEELIHNAINKAGKMFSTKAITVADIGTGSGAIGITFKKEWPDANVTATDISSSALTVAKENANLLDAAVHFKEGNLTEPIQNDKWDIVLSNPPYIAYDEATSMSETVLSFEPHHALFADEDGLYFYRKLAENLPKLMNKTALIGIEIGHEQGLAVHKLFEEAFPNASIELVKDINGKDRMLFCELSE